MVYDNSPQDQFSFVELGLADETLQSRTCRPRRLHRLGSPVTRKVFSILYRSMFALLNFYRRTGRILPHN